jgi:hypothetical protein
VRSYGLHHFRLGVLCLIVISFRPADMKSLSFVVSERRIVAQAEGSLMAGPCEVMVKHAPQHKKESLISVGVIALLYAPGNNFLQRLFRRQHLWHEIALLESRKRAGVCLFLRSMDNSNGVYPSGRLAEIAERAKSAVKARPTRISFNQIELADIYQNPRALRIGEMLHVIGGDPSLILDGKQCAYGGRYINSSQNDHSPFRPMWLRLLVGWILFCCGLLFCGLSANKFFRDDPIGVRGALIIFGWLTLGALFMIPGISLLIYGRPLP